MAQRTLEELPWQLREAGSWEDLYGVLADPQFRDALGESRSYELTGYWLELERQVGAGARRETSRGIVDASTGVLHAPERETATAVERVAALLTETGHGQHALTLFEHLAGRYAKCGDRSALQATLGRRAGILHAPAIWTPLSSYTRNRNGSASSSLISMDCKQRWAVRPAFIWRGATSILR